MIESVRSSNVFMSRRVTFICLSILTVLVACSPILGQTLDNEGLVLIGSVQSIKTTEKEDRRLYEIVLKIQFRNESEKTLIMLSPQFMTRRIEFLYQSMGNESRPPDDAEKAVSTFSIQPKVHEWVEATDSDWFGWWLQQLDKPDPNQAPVLSLKPGVTVEYSDTINLQQKFRVEGPKGKKVKIWEGFSDSGKAPYGIPLTDLPAFTVEYHISVGDRYRNPEILRELRERWASYGRLVLDDNGNFTLKSKRILNSDGK